MRRRTRDVAPGNEAEAALSLYPKPGAVIAGCRLEKPLGHGGCGQVYLAQELEWRRPVAVKIVMLGEQGREWRERFSREARALARLVHPGVVRLYRAGISEPYGYLVMELVAGVDLGTWWKGRTDPVARAGILGKVLAAMEAMHRQGIVHRDLKPANIMVTAEGEPRLLDFGLSHNAYPVDCGIHYG